MQFIVMRNTENGWAVVQAQDAIDLETIETAMAQAAGHAPPLSDNYVGELAIYEVKDGDPPEIELVSHVETQKPEVVPAMLTRKEPEDIR